MSVQFFQTPDCVQIAYELKGELTENTPLLFLNGMFGDMPFWDTLVEALSPDRLCVRMDHRGVGLSERWIGTYSYELYAQDVLELLNHLHIERVHVVGLCHGGMVGAVLARDYPARLASLSLLGSRLLRSEKMRLYETLRRDFIQREGVVAMSMMQSWIIFGESFLQEHAPYLQAMANNSTQRISQESAVLMVDAIIDFEMSPAEISAMTVPAQFIVGEEDTYSPPWLVKRSAALWPNARFIEIPRCAHILPREAFAQLHNLLQTFIGH